MDVIKVSSDSDACSDGERLPEKRTTPADSTALLLDDCEATSPMPAPGRLVIPTHNSDTERFHRMCDLYRR